MYCCDQWVDISDGIKGLAVIPLDTPLFSIGEKGILAYRKDYLNTDTTLIFNVFNNSWGTNFPQWISGDFTARFRLIPHQGEWSAAEISKYVLETCTPLLATRIASRSPGGTAMSLTFAETFIQTEAGMEITAFKQAEDGDGFIVRLHDIQGKQRHTLIKLSDRIAGLKVCDLLEHNGGECSITDGQFIFETMPFEVHTYRLNLKLP